MTGTTTTSWDDLTPGLVEARGSDGWDDLTPGLVEVSSGSDGWDDHDTRTC